MKAIRKIETPLAGWAFILSTLVTWAGSSLPCLAFQQNQSPARDGQAEMTSNDSSPTFQLKTERNLVVVHIVVRDSRGNVRGGLHQEDFHIFDDGKPQTITHFTFETPNSDPAAGAAPQPASSSGSGSNQPAERAANGPRRFLALFFDDLSLSLGDAMRIKLVARQFVDNAMLPGDRIGVFTTSGRSQADFTDDREAIRQAISGIYPHPLQSDPENECPEIFDYQAFLIITQHDQRATDIASEEYFHCNCENMQGDAQAMAECRSMGDRMVESDAQRVFSVSEANSAAEVREIERVVRHIATFPGQRTILIVSPGFLSRSFEFQLNEVVDRALHANVTINSLDAKGLYAPLPGGDDISRSPVITPKRPDLVGQKEQFRIDRQAVADEPLATLAYDTGGRFFHNNNDLNEGFREGSALPESYYVITFSPGSLKPNGRFHPIKVSLAQPAGLAVQARKGYFAPKKADDPVEQAKEEIREAVFSPDEMSELPIDVHTQYFRTNDSSAKLSVLTHVDLRFVHFRKQEDRNADELTMVTVLFDHNGKYIEALEKTVTLRLRDSTLQRLSATGITLKTSFDVNPGSYVVRQIVRDTDGHRLSGTSRPVDITF